MRVIAFAGACVLASLPTPGFTAASENKAGYRSAKSVCVENWVVPPGLGGLFPLFPPLKRWAKFDRPSGAGFTTCKSTPLPENEFSPHTGSAAPPKSEFFSKLYSR
jgi:hypothetical protein